LKKLLLVGAGGFGRVVLEHARNDYDCAFVDDGYEKGAEICGIKVVGKLDDLVNLYPEYNLISVTIGNNALRGKVYSRAIQIGYDFPNIIGQNVYISPYASIGTGCVLLNNVTIQNGSKVGSGIILNPGVEIHHDSEVGDYSLIYTNSVIRTYARIGKRVKIGSNVSISNEAIVEDDSIIEDGAVITKDWR